ncbi:hypothetical protein A0130_02470 [Leifsonia xyli]|nr:hypothetical protein A0130_02470 [Leifsonia xyli]
MRSKSEEQARIKLDAARLELIEHGNVITDRSTVEDVVWYWYENHDIKPSTRASYRSKITNQIVPFFGAKLVRQVTVTDIREWHKWQTRPSVVNGKATGDLGLSQSSARTAHFILSQALQEARAQKLVRTNEADLAGPPEIDASATGAMVRGALTSEQAFTLLEHVADDRLAARWVMALLTGARQGECLGLTLDRVDFDAGVLDLSWQLQRIAWRHGCVPDRQEPVCGHAYGAYCPDRVLDAKKSWTHRHLVGGLYLSSPKTKSSTRTIPLVEPFTSILRERVEAAKDEANPHGLVFTSGEKYSGPNAKERSPIDGSPLDPSRDSKRWKALLNEVGLPDVKLHSARNTAVTTLLDLDVPPHVVQQIVGHGSVDMTRRYDRPNVERLRAHMGKLEGAYGGVWTAAGQR